MTDLGQALHTLQDSFSHAFRTPDQHSVTVALNWVDTITGLDESRDGPAHMGKMDACKDIDSFRTDRMAAAVEASEALMRVALDPRAGVRRYRGGRARRPRCLAHRRARLQLRQSMV